MLVADAVNVKHGHTTSPLLGICAQMDITKMHSLFHLHVHIDWFECMQLLHNIKQRSDLIATKQSLSDHVGETVGLFLGKMWTCIVQNVRYLYNITVLCMFLDLIKENGKS